MAVLQRLAHHLQHVAAEFGELVEKQHAAVRERHFAGHGVRTAAQEAGVRHRVVRRAERTARHKRLARLQHARDGMDARDLQRLLRREGRQDGRNPPREHRLARAGRADHQEVVPARHGHLDRALRVVLPLHVGKVVAAVAAGGHARGEVRAHGGDRERARDEVHGLAQAAHGIHVDAVND